MSSLNRVQIIGHLGRDPEIRAMQSGDKVATINVAVSEKWTDRNSGERREKTEWVRCVAFGKLAETMERYLAKGSKVYCEGKFSTRKWTDQSGQDRYSTEVVMQGFDGKLVMLDGPKQGGDRQEQRSAHASGHDNGFGSPERNQAPVDDLDSEIPF